MRLTAILLLFKEAPFVEACVRAIYPVVDSICCVTQYDRNLAGAPVQNDASVETYLKVPDPDNKLSLLMVRDVSTFSGQNTEARLRNAAMAANPHADYFLIIDSDEIWPRDVLQKCWDYVKETKAAAYRSNPHIYFKKWNYRIKPSPRQYKIFVFARQGFRFKADRVLDWRGPARWKEYLRTGRKPKTIVLPEEWKFHHGVTVGDDARVEAKLKNYTHSDLVDPDWIDRVWKNFTPDMTDFYYFKNLAYEYSGVDVISSSELPEEITGRYWPPGWLDKP